MYGFIEDRKDLIGKEIAYVNFARFAEARVIATKDKQKENERLQYERLKQKFEVQE